MSTLAIPAKIRQDMLDQLDNLPRPKYLAGKVVVCFELHCRPDGTVGDLHVETSVRETRRVG